MFGPSDCAKPLSPVRLITRRTDTAIEQLLLWRTVGVCKKTLGLEFWLVFPATQNERKRNLGRLRPLGCFRCSNRNVGRYLWNSTAYNWARTPQISRPPNVIASKANKLPSYDASMNVDDRNNGHGNDGESPQSSSADEVSRSCNTPQCSSVSSSHSAWSVSFIALSTSRCRCTVVPARGCDMDDSVEQG